jgi:hypothetical protein
MVFGLMAFSATAAQAETGAKWLILNSKGEIKTPPTLVPPIGLSAITTGVLHTEISKTKVLFECTTLSTVNAKLLENGSIGESTGNVKGSQVKFSGCITKLNGVTTSSCEPNAGGTQKGVIVTQPGHALIVLHVLENGTKDPIVKILPDTGETFAFIELGELCSIGEKVPVIGEAALKDCSDRIANEETNGCEKELFTQHRVKHIVEPFTPLTKLWTINKTTEHIATILGTALAFLTGEEHTGLEFSGDPN